MASQQTKNSHFIARHLTKPWECETPGSKRALWFYDFDADQFDTLPSPRTATMPSSRRW